MDFPIWVLFLFATLICNFDHATAQTADFWGEYCGSSGNYSADSGYQRDLEELLPSFTETNNGYGFYKSTTGQAHAAALCRGDITPEKCRQCVEDSTSRIRQVCHNQIEAIGLYDACFLTYSNRSRCYGDDVETHNSSNPNKILDSLYDLWNQTVANFLESLRPKAAGGGQLRKYASDNITVSGLQTIYAYMQCIPDLSATECDECLAGATAEIRRFNRSLGARVFKPCCVVRYQTYSFFGPTWYPLPPPLPPSPQSTPPPPPLPSSGEWFLAKREQDLAVDYSIDRKLMFVTINFEIGPTIPMFQVRITDGSPARSKHEMEIDDTGDMYSFALSTIQVATDDFSFENKLGEGGFGAVYWGKLQDGKEIAVKRLCRNTGQGSERLFVEFKTEVGLIIKLQHKNLVRLLGYCVQGSERLLIYEFMANKSLDTILFDRNRCKELDWAKRANIVTGIAKGLQYLHEDSRLRIVHRDMKAGNILLDADMNSKISDFGTARIFGGEQMEANTIRIVGTYGYMAPEYAMEGLFSTKSDVYSFGVLLLEIITGQQNNRFYYQNQPQNFLSTVYRLWRENKGETLIDDSLIQNSPVTEVLRWINIALLCVQEDPLDRPTMSTVVFMLEGQWSVNLPTPSEPPTSFARFAAVSERTSSSIGEVSAYPTFTIHIETSSTRVSR
ncbi:hypothetical protein OSB04_002392 [Centaurea solstitialis]|uniref:Uncharacterized protein n=1 Tax=Centaurea solstitialis TaxID=347529 RepID=A0AA38U3F3_9ASTR|nr:hypothetical protein OSB04_002392 [Centaurea solstitialis]